MDPVTHFMLSPYQSFDNNPIYFIDPKGTNASGNGGGDKKVKVSASVNQPIPNEAKPNYGKTNKFSLAEDILKQVKTKVNVASEAKPSEIMPEGKTTLLEFANALLGNPSLAPTAPINIEYDDYGTDEDELDLTLEKMKIVGTAKLINVGASSKTESTGSTKTYSVEEFNKLSFDASVNVGVESEKKGSKKGVSGEINAGYESGQQKSTSTTNTLNVSNSYTITSYTYEVMIEFTIKMDFDDQDELQWGGGDNKTGTITIKVPATITVESPLF